ncbi:MAG: hypothetical protein GY714_15230 [Desulfobacterales bacterium]|nr:hypothetical protein [Desulfobacterales bacterium]
MKNIIVSIVVVLSLIGCNGLASKNNTDLKNNTVYVNLLVSNLSYAIWRVDIRAINQILENGIALDRCVYIDVTEANSKVPNYKVIKKGYENIQNTIENISPKFSVLKQKIYKNQNSKEMLIGKIRVIFLKR